MNKVEIKTDVGVIVGRFMTHLLTEGHKDLIQTVLDRHERVIVFLGVSPVKNTTKQPLDFRSRKYMLEQEYPKLEVFPIHDNRSDETWSKKDLSGFADIYGKIYNTIMDDINTENRELNDDESRWLVENTPF